ncbi:MAG TPA: hypothetical protein VHG08_26585 [Longimicrobium sp.]|nr:hypothetical protein [Longimicrobium sp.]
MSEGRVFSRRRVLAPLMAAAAVAAPIGFNGGPSTVGDACAQTGICYMDALSVCFVNGVAYPGMSEGPGD